MHNVIELARQGLRNCSRSQIFFIAAMLWICLNLHFMPDKSLRYKNPYAAKGSILIQCIQEMSNYLNGSVAYIAFVTNLEKVIET